MRPEEWLSWILDRLPRLPEHSLPTAEALGSILAHEVRAEHELPLWTNSAMDGYAVRSADLAAASESSPVELVVTGEMVAGSADDPDLRAGEAVRIMTGAPVPSAADAVIPVESAAGEGGAGHWGEHRIRVGSPFAPGANIRMRGEDVRAGEVIARAGERLTAMRAAAIAAAGVARVRVRRVPRVAVVTSGSELVPAGAALSRGLIPESNSVLIAGLLREAGIEAALIEHGTDEVALFRRRLDALSREVDVIVTTGGIGPGTHDVVRLAVEDEPEVRAVRIRVKPGQPQCAGRLAGGAFLFSLPGNPVSAAVSFELFVRPALLSLQGTDRPHRMRVPAVADTGWRGASGRLQVLPVRIWESEGALRCAPVVNPRTFSHAVGRGGAADGYALVAEDVGDVAPGDTVSIILTTS